MVIFSSREFEGRAVRSAPDQQISADAFRLALAEPTYSPQTHQTAEVPWKMVQMDCDVDDAESINELLPLFQKARPLLLYLHGFISTPAAFFERCDRLELLYGLEIVRFSWTSKKHRLDDGFRPAVDPKMEPSLQQELERLFGAQAGSPSTNYPAPLYPVAGSQDNLTCSWWLLMTLTGVRH